MHKGMESMSSSQSSSTARVTVELNVSQVTTEKLRKIFRFVCIHAGMVTS